MATARSRSNAAVASGLTARSVHTALAFCVWLLAWSPPAPAADGLRWTLIRNRIAKEFPEVPQIATRELAAWLADDTRKKPVLLDVRTPEEYAVSHLPGARRVDPESQPARIVPRISKDRPIVTYCSVGYRSAALADRLRQAGYTRVQNLAGSIFQWANEDRPLERDGKPAKLVHPYSFFWSGMLKKERRAPNK